MQRPIFIKISFYSGALTGWGSLGVWDDGDSSISNQLLCAGWSHPIPSHPPRLEILQRHTHDYAPLWFLHLCEATSIVLRKYNSVLGHLGYWEKPQCKCSEVTSSSSPISTFKAWLSEVCFQISSDPQEYLWKFMAIWKVFQITELLQFCYIKY